jgi:hypothetical protein
MFGIAFEEQLVCSAAIGMHLSQLIELPLLVIHVSAVEGGVNIDDFLVALRS